MSAPTLNRAAAALGRRGGASTSARKVAAARENGKRGGRPRKVAAPVDHIFALVTDDGELVTEIAVSADTVAEVRPYYPPTWSADAVAVAVYEDRVGSAWARVGLTPADGARLRLRRF